MPLIDFSTAALAKSGDVNPGGGGMTTSGSTNATVLAAYNEDAIGSANSVVVAPGAIGTVAGHVIPWWVAIIGVLVVWAFFDAKNEKAQLTDVRVGFGNSLKTAIFVLVWFTLFKWVFGTYVVPGLSAIVEGV